jgi:hypothetical protein
LPKYIGNCPRPLGTALENWELPKDAKNCLRIYGFSLDNFGLPKALEFAKGDQDLSNAIRSCLRSMRVALIIKSCYRQFGVVLSNWVMPEVIGNCFKSLGIALGN